jgi:8-oxo-dGTP pyrophosphatase MutT (NUDIX family)
MNRAEFRNTLLSLDLSARPDEVTCRQRMVELLDSCPNCFRRDAFPGHFTGSAFVVSADGARSLLHHHRKLDRWLQFGGHCDGEEDVLSVAQREAYEESGIQGLVGLISISTRFQHWETNPGICTTMSDMFSSLRNRRRFRLVRRARSCVGLSPAR